MAKYVQDKQGNVWEDEGDGMGRKLSQEEASVIGQNPLETFGNSLAVSAAQAYKGGQQLLGNEQAQRDLQIAGRMQAGMGQQNPISNFLGQAAPGALAAVGSAGLGTIPAILADTALGAAYSPENPLAGAALGAVTGGAPMVAGAVRQYGGRMADRVLSKVDEASSFAPERIVRPTEQMASFVQDAESLGLRVPASIRMQSQLAENVGLTLESSPLTSWAVPQTAAHNTNVLGSLVKRATGMADDVAITPANIRAAEKVTGAQFREFADMNSQSATKQQVAESAMAALEDSFVGKAKFESKMKTLIADFKNETMSGNDLMRLQSSIGDLARKAKGDQQVQISNARDAVLGLIPANKGAEMQYKAAREQWAAQRALLDSVGQRGAVSAARLRKRLKVAEANRDTPLGQLARAAEAVDYMRPSSYGTENARRGGLTGTVLTGTGVAGGLGYAGGLFGN